MGVPRTYGSHNPAMYQVPKNEVQKPQEEATYLLQEP
jgi:hypothetical protein